MIPEKITNSYKAVCDMIEQFCSSGEKIPSQLIGFEFDGDDVSSGHSRYLFEGVQASALDIIDALGKWDVVLYVLDETDQSLNAELNFNVKAVGVVIFTKEATYRGTWIVDLDSGNFSPSDLKIGKSIDPHGVISTKTLH